MRLKDKVGIVTGAGSGFGEGIAKGYAAEGASVVINDINEQAGRRVAREIEDSGGKASYVFADVTSDGDVAAMVDETFSLYGRLDVVMNNAGYTYVNRWLLDVDEDEFDKVFDVNVKALYLSAKHVVPRFMELGGGCFLTVASTAGLRPRPGLTWYNASKGAAITLTKSMAVELAPHNIRVNCLCPVLGDTGMTDRFVGGEVTPDVMSKFVSTIPLGRMSTPADLANAAIFLADPASSFLTGLALEVDGGRCI